MIKRLFTLVMIFVLIVCISGSPAVASIGVVGTAMTSPSGSVANGYTRIAAGASNFEGTITTVYVWPVTVAWTGTRVGTFYYVSGTTWTCRDSVGIGDVATGLQSFTVSLHVHAGDYIGFWQQGSNNYVGSSSGSGWGSSGGRANKCTTGTSWTYNQHTSYGELCRGEGAIGAQSVGSIDSVLISPIETLDGVTYGLVKSLDGIQ